MPLWFYSKHLPDYHVDSRQEAKPVHSVYLVYLCIGLPVNYWIFHISLLIGGIYCLCSLYIGNAIQAFGNGTDVSVWQPMPPVQTTASMTTPSQRVRDRDKLPNAIEPATHINHLNPADNSLYQFCGSLQVSGSIADIDLHVSCMYCGFGVLYVPQGVQGFKTDYVFVVLMCSELINTSWKKCFYEGKSSVVYAWFERAILRHRGGRFVTSYSTEYFSGVGLVLKSKFSSKNLKVLLTKKSYYQCCQTILGQLSQR